MRFFLAVLFSFSVFGETMFNYIQPTSTNATYPVTLSRYMKGARMTWATDFSQLTSTVASVGIPVARREAGMEATVLGLATYRLSPDLVTWMPFDPLVNVSLASSFSTLNPVGYTMNTIVATGGNTTVTNGSGGYYQIVSSTNYTADGLGIIATANANYNMMLINNNNPWNAKQIGFLADGSTDQLPKFITAGYNDRYCRMYFPEGTYNYSSQIGFTNGANGRTNGVIYWVGDGSSRTVFRPTSAYSSTPPNSTPPSDNSIAIYFNLFTNVYIKGISKRYGTVPTWNVYTNWFQTANVARAYGLRIRKCQNVYVEDFLLENSIHIGIGFADSTNVYAKNLHVQTSIKDAIAFDTDVPGVGKWTIEDSYINGFGDSALAIIESFPVTDAIAPAKVFVKNVRTENAIAFSERDVFPKNSGQGLTVNGIKDLTIIGCNFGGAVELAVASIRSGPVLNADYGANIVFNSNIVRDGGTNDFGFLVEGYTGGVVNGNIFDSLFGCLGFQTLTNVNISGNVSINQKAYRPFDHAVNTNYQYIVSSASGTGTVTYNGNVLTNLQTIAAGTIDGGGNAVTNYTTTGDGEMIARNVGMVRFAGFSDFVTFENNQFGPVEALAVSITSSPNRLFFNNNRFMDTWTIGQDPFYGAINLDAAQNTNLIIGSHNNYFGGSKRYVGPPVTVNAADGQRIHIPDIDTDIVSEGSFLGTTNLTITLPTVAMVEFDVYTTGNILTNSIAHYAVVELYGTVYSTTFWEQMTNSPLSGNYRLLRRKDSLLSEGGPETGYNIRTNTASQYEVSIGYGTRVSGSYKVFGKNYRD